MRNVLLMLCLSLPVFTEAQIYLVDTNSFYFQDFNGLDSFGTAATRLPAGWSFYEWGSAANTSYRAGTGTTNASDTYSFGAAQSRDRALGSLASGTLTRIVYGTSFINRTGSDINAVSITYKGEQWRRGGSGSPDSLRFYFTTVPGVKLGDTAAGSWTEVPALLFRSVSTLSSSAGLNGNDSSRVLHAELPVMLHPGDTMTVRWCDFNAAGSDDGLAVDSFSVQFHNGAVSQSNHPRLIAFSPDSSAALTAPISLQLTFDRGVRAGTGNLYLYDLSTAQFQTIAAVNAQLRSAGREAVFSGLQLTPGDRYLVRFDSTAFDSAGYRSCGLTDSSWTFRISQPGTGIVLHAATGGSLQALSDGRMLLSLDAVPEAPCVLRLVSMDGRTLRERRVIITSKTTVFAAETAPSGCYLAVFRTNSSTLRTRICVP